LTSPRSRTRGSHFIATTPTSLHIIFADGSQIIILPFFGADGVLANLTIELGPNLDLDGAQFAAQFPITTDQSVLPAAGNTGNPSSGAEFHDPSSDPLQSGFDTLALLTNENVPHFQINSFVPNFVENVPELTQVSGSVGGIVEETFLIVDFDHRQ
jgi:hypothetical protein